MKNDKRYPQQLSPIYLRITIDGKRAELSTGQQVLPGHWIPKTGRVTRNDKKSKDLNAYLSLLETKVHEAYIALVQRNELITAAAIKTKVTGIAGTQKTLIPIFQKHNNRMAALVPQHYAVGTLDRYKTSLSHTIQFLQWAYNCSDIDIKAIDHEFVANYDFFLRSVRHCSHNTTVKYLRNFRKIIHICRANGWIDKDPFKLYDTKIRKVERTFLSDDELTVIMSKSIQIKRLALVRDIFVFSCLTGLAYADLKKLRASHIVMGIDHQRWVSIERTKTHALVNVPLLPAALSILDKYKKCVGYYCSPIFPILSNQKMNSYLKEIADICQINKNITFHVGRHTFATTVTLNNNVPIETISKMLGHKNITTTQHYAKILDIKVSQDMHLLYSKFL